MRASIVAILSFQDLGHEWPHLDWDTKEVWQLRTVTEAAAITDLRHGRMRGVLSWALVDAALQTGLRASELAKLNVGDFNAKRQSLKVWRHKRRKHFQETMAISKALANHLTEFIAWKSDVGQSVGKNAPLFVGKRGRLTASGIAQLWKSTVKRAGVDAERRSIHNARHTMACIC